MQIKITTPDGFRHTLSIVNGSPDYDTYTTSANTIRALQDAYNAGNWEELPEPEPMPEENPPQWLEFYNALLVSAPYQRVRAIARTNTEINLLYTDLAGNLTAAITGIPNLPGFQFTFSELKLALEAADEALTPEETATLQEFGTLYGIEVDW